MNDKKDLDGLKLAFQDEFTSIMKQFNDTRKFQVLSIGDKGIFSNYFNYVGQEMDHLGYGYLYADKNNIEFYFHDEGMLRWFTQLPSPKFPEEFGFFELAIRQVARHEYGHLFLTPTNFDALPKLIRDYLKKEDAETFEGYMDIFYNRPEELIEAEDNSKLIRAQEGLNTVKISWVGNLIKEFLADRDYLDHIKEEFPLELTDLRIYDIAIAIAACVDTIDQVSIMPFYPFKYKEFVYDKVFRIIGMSNMFFFYGAEDLEDLKKLFVASDFTKCFDFVVEVLEKIEKIVNAHKTLDDMEDEIISLAKDMDRPNYFRFIDPK